MTAILSFSATLEVIAALVFFFAVLALFLWLDYRRLCRASDARERHRHEAVDLGAAILDYKVAQDLEAEKEWRP